MPSREDAAAVSRAVLDTVTERITGRQAACLTAYLPVGLTAGLSGAGRYAGQYVFRRAEFFTAVAAAEGAGIDLDTADLHARAVLHTVRQTMPEGEAADIISRLPDQLTELLA